MVNDIERYLKALHFLAGKDVSAPFQWDYEKARAEGKVLLPPPPPHISKGKYSIGDVIWNGSVTGKFGLREKELPQHIAIFGRTGGGKTNCALLLTQQLIEKQKPFLIFDWKGSYRNLSAKIYNPGVHGILRFHQPVGRESISIQCPIAYYRSRIFTTIGTIRIIL